MEKEVYLNYIKRNKKGKQPPIACIVCGKDNPEVIEMHHVEGRNISDWVEPLCKNCHFEVTSVQNKVNPKARSKDSSLKQKKAYCIISACALMMKILEHVIQAAMEMTENV